MTGRPYQPIPRPRRIHDRKAIAAARRGYCEYCGGRPPEGCQVHHIKSRGSGGGDVDGNLISLCAACHTATHAGRISRSRLRAIVATRS